MQDPSDNDMAKLSSNDVIDLEREAQYLSESWLNGSFLEFLEVFIHQILYIRNVYPQEIFERRRKYGIPVWMSRHPGLNEYIFQFLRHTAPIMDQGLMQSFALVILKQPKSGLTRSPAEKYIMDLGTGLSAAHGDTKMTSQGGNEKLEAQFKAVLIKLSLAETNLVDPDPDDSFTLLIQTHKFDAQSSSDGKKASEAFLNSCVDQSDKWVDGSSLVSDNLDGDAGNSAQSTLHTQAPHVLPLYSFEFGEDIAQFYVEVSTPSI